MYHVVLEQGRTLGPFDRRTIVGMRIKKALTSKHVLVDSAGTRLTVGASITPFPLTYVFGAYTVAHGQGMAQAGLGMRFGGVL